MIIAEVPVIPFIEAVKACYLIGPAFILFRHHGAFRIIHFSLPHELHYHNKLL